MSFDRPANDRQPQARALDLTLRMMFLNPVKPFENIRQVSRRYTHAIVTDRNLNLALRFFSLNLQLQSPQACLPIPLPRIPTATSTWH